MGEVTNLVANNIDWVFDKLAKMRPKINHVVAVVALEIDGEPTMITLQGADDNPRPMEISTGLSRLQHLLMHTIEGYEEDL